MVLTSFIDNNELKPDPMELSIKIERDCPLSIETDTEEEEAEIKEKSYEQKMCTAVSAELGARVKILLVFFVCDLLLEFIDVERVELSYYHAINSRLFYL